MHFDKLAVYFSSPAPVPRLEQSDATPAPVPRLEQSDATRALSSPAQPGKVDGLAV